MAGKAFTGPRARLVVEGKTIGWCTGIEITENTQYEPVDPIDQIHTAEHAAVAVRVTGSCKFVRIVNNPESAIGLGQKLKDLIAGSDGLTMQCLDNVTNSVVYTVWGWKPENRSFNVEGRGLAMTNVTFVGKVLLDENQQLDPPLL